MGSNVLVARVLVPRVLVAGCNVNDGFRLVFIHGHRKKRVDKDRRFCRVGGRVVTFLPSLGRCHPRASLPNVVRCVVHPRGYRPVRRRGFRAFCPWSALKLAHQGSFAGFLPLVSLKRTHQGQFCGVLAPGQA